MAAVTLETIVKKFGETIAVDDLSLHVEDGEFVVLVGPSGCGKTTTLNMIAGLERPTSGQILIDGNRVERVPPDKRNIAMVFQSIALYPHMSVSQNIGFPLRMANVSRTETHARVREVAQLLRIEELLDRRPHQLSGGQRQRVALGRAVVRKPAVFLFDEPLSSLDAKLRVDMRVELKKLHERLNATFIYVTHDQVEGMTMADRIAVMDFGRLLQVADPREVYRRPANLMIAGFIGSPGMNFVPGRLAGDREGLEFSGRGVALRLPQNQFATTAQIQGAKVTLGIRPEAVIAGNSGGPEVATVTGNVFAIEPLGSDLFLDIAFEEATLGVPSLFKVRAPAELRVRVGERIPLGLPHDNIYLFDASGWRIHPA